MSPQVTRGTRVLAETSFPEDTVADHVGGTRGRRYYEHLSDDEDLVASGGKVAPGGWVSPWVGVIVGGCHPGCDSCCPRCRWHGDLVASGGKVAPGATRVGVTVGGCHYEWMPPWVGATLGATRAVPIGDGTGIWWHPAVRWHWVPQVGATVGGCHHEWVPPWVPLPLSPLQMAAASGGIRR